MKSRGLKMLVFVESMVLLAAAVFVIVGGESAAVKTEVYRQSSADGAHTVAIYEIGEPDWPFGAAHYEVRGPADFYVDVADDGGHGWFDVVWEDASVVITFGGSEQKDAVYELPFN